MPIGGLFPGIAKTWPFLILAGFFHFALSGGQSEVFKFFPRIDFTYEGLLRALFFVTRLGLIIAVSISLFLIYDPQQYGRAIGRLLSRLPLKDSAAGKMELLITLALRFVPFLHQEYGRLQMALTARGTATAKGPITRFKRVRILATPLLLSAFRRADQVAMALEARGYNPAVRMTAYRTAQPQRGEYIGCALLCACCIGALWL